MLEDISYVKIEFYFWQFFLYILKYTVPCKRPVIYLTHFNYI